MSYAVIRRRRNDAKYLLYDNFAGAAVNSIKWKLTDTTGKVSIVNGELVYASNAVPQYGDPQNESRIAYVRASGLTFECRMKMPSTDTTVPVAISPVSASYGYGGGANQLGFLIRDGKTIAYYQHTAYATLRTYTSSSYVWLREIILADGVLLQTSNDGITYYSHWFQPYTNAGPFYYGLGNYNGDPHWDYAKVYYGSAPQPLAQTCPAITPTLGAEENSGTLVVGTWYQITASELNHFYAGSAVDDTFWATATTALDANNKVKALSTLTSAAYDVGVKSGFYRCVPVTAAQSQAGIIVCANAALTYYVHAYVDRVLGKAILDKIVNGTRTNLTSGTITYGSTKILALSLYGTTWQLYYDGAGVGTAQTLDVSSNYGSNLHGWSAKATGDPGIMRRYV